MKKGKDAFIKIGDEKIEFTKPVQGQKVGGNCAAEIGIGIATGAEDKRGYVMVALTEFDGRELYMPLDPDEAEEFASQILELVKEIVKS